MGFKDERLQNKQLVGTLSLATYALQKLLRKSLSDQHDTIFFKNIQSASSSKLQEEITAVRTHLPLPYHFKHTPRALVENSVF
jgi:hypothetical protein